MKNKNRQKKSQQKAKRAINKIKLLLSNNIIKIRKNDFLEQFMLCETACKIIIQDYYKEKGKQVKEKDIKLHMGTIKSAMKYAGYCIDEKLLATIFKSNTQRGNKSCKELRDSIAHGMHIEDIKEVADRYYLLSSKMQQFLEYICDAPNRNIKKAS